MRRFFTKIYSTCFVFYIIFLSCLKDEWTIFRKIENFLWNHMAPIARTPHEKRNNRPSNARWKQSKRFNSERRCNITVPGEIESRSPVVLGILTFVSYHRRLLRWRDHPLLISRKGDDRINGRRILRMNFSHSFSRLTRILFPSVQCPFCLSQSSCKVLHKSLSFTLLGLYHCSIRIYNSKL